MNRFKNAQIILLPTRDKTRISLNKNNLLINRDIYTIGQDDEIYQHLHIVNNDKIQKNDWYYSECVKSIYQAIYFPLSLTDAQKVIATTDITLTIVDKHIFNGHGNNHLLQPSKEWIEYYISEYNKGNVITDVLVELKSSNLHFFNGDLRVTPDNTINIKSTKGSWNREELITLVSNAFKAGYERSYSGYPNIDNHTKPKIEDWIKQNLRLFDII